MYSHVGNSHRWLLDPTPSEEFYYKYARLGRPLWTAFVPTIPVVFICLLLGATGLFNGTEFVASWTMITLAAVLVVVPVAHRQYARWRNGRFMFSGRVIALDFGVIGESLRQLIFRNAPEFTTQRQLEIIRESCTGLLGMREVTHPLNAFLKDKDAVTLLCVLDTRDKKTRQQAIERLEARASCSELLAYMDSFVQAAQESDREDASLAMRADAVMAEMSVRVQPEH